MLQSTLNHTDTVFRTSNTGGGLGTIPKMRTIVNGDDEVLVCRGSPRSSRIYEDTLDLTKELKNAAEQCQLLAGKLCDRKEFTKKKPESLKECNSPEADNKDDLRRKIQALVDENLQLRQRMKKELLSDTCKELENDTNSDIEVKLKAAVEENIRLRHILKDVTQVNKRWQKYNRDRQDYVQRLLTTIHDLEQKAQDCASKMNVSSETVIDKNIVNRYSDSAILNPLGELGTLRKTHDHCLKENVRLQRESQEMKANMDDLLHQFECIKIQNTEQEEMLQLQANMFKEDFLAEQKEKVAALAKLNELESQHAALTEKCKTYEQRLQQAEKAICPGSSFRMETVDMKGCVGSSTYPRAHRPLYTSKSASCHIQPRFIGNIVIDNGVEKKSNDCPLQQLTDPLLSVGEHSAVVCPRCGMLFPSNRHSEFLDHYRQCKENKSY